MEIAAGLIEGIDTSAFPTAWTTWTPATYGGGGSLTFTGPSFTYTKYIRRGKLIIASFNLAGTLGGTASNYVYFAPPSTMVAASGTSLGAVWVNENSTWKMGMAMLEDTANVRVYKSDASNYLNSGTCTLRGVIVYEGV